jgi:hypothetical protein
VATRVALQAVPDRPRRTLALLPARVRAMRRPKWWQEIAFIGVCYWLYSLVRNAVPSHQVAAGHRAFDLLTVERALHLGVEKSVNLFVAHNHWLAYICNYYYSTLHFVVTPAVLVWLYLRHQDRYVFYRRLIFATTVLALIGFWLLPLAPPRMLPGFVDTVLAFHTEGLYASGASPIGSVSNQYAAMPSLHTGWALWCAIAVADVVRPRWAKVLAFCYPAATIVAILGTANHYFLDAVGGAITLGLGYLATRGVRLVVPRLGPVARVFSTD